MNDFKLDIHPKISSGLKAPDGYFDTLPDTVTQRLVKDTPRVIPLYRRPWLNAVAAVLLIALMVTVWYRPETNTEPDLAAIENYFKYSTNLSQYELVNNLDAAAIENIDPGFEVDDATIEELLSTNPNFDNYITD